MPTKPEIGAFTPNFPKHCVIAAEEWSMTEAQIDEDFKNYIYDHLDLAAGFYDIITPGQV
jgi:hypothetical protein